MKDEPQYWVVGASWGGREDQAPVFIKRGHWFLGYDDDKAPDQAARRDQIRAGDRIAIKKMMGQGASTVRVTAIGIVKDVDDDMRVYVAWILTDLDCVVEGRGCFKSVHGPFGAADPWTREVFQL